MSDSAPRFCSVMNILSWKVAASLFAIFCITFSLPAIWLVERVGICSGPISPLHTLDRKSGFLGSVRLNFKLFTFSVYLSAVLNSLYRASSILPASSVQSSPPPTSDSAFASTFFAFMRLSSRPRPDKEDEEEREAMDAGGLESFLSSFFPLPFPSRLVEESERFGVFGAGFPVGVELPSDLGAPSRLFFTWSFHCFVRFVASLLTPSSGWFRSALTAIPI
mmetsp:Transcript_48336/g.114150  ORF Transcript_48336/g.114150 Transcript_48336/m.114150 type:complete len:221 (-) Transcript_48336:170-832(-)